MSKRNMIIAGAVVAVILVGAIYWLALRPVSGTSGAVQTPRSTETSSSATSSPDASASLEASASEETSGATAEILHPAIPTGGAHEKAAMAAVPSVLKTAAANKKKTGAKMPDLSSAKPILTSYGLIARVGQKIYLFQVFAEGKAYEYLRYPVEPDAANQYPLDATGFAGDPLVDPGGTREKAAAAAVRSLMDKAFPGSKAKVQMWNYAFTFVGKNGKPVTLADGTIFQIMITPTGKLAAME